MELSQQQQRQRLVAAATWCALFLTISVVQVQSVPLPQPPPPLQADAASASDEDQQTRTAQVQAIAPEARFFGNLGGLGTGMGDMTGLGGGFRPSLFGGQQDPTYGQIGYGNPYDTGFNDPSAGAMIPGMGMGLPQYGGYPPIKIPSFGAAQAYPQLGAFDTGLGGGGAMIPPYGGGLGLPQVGTPSIGGPGGMGMMGGLGGLGSMGGMGGMGGMGMGIPGGMGGMEGGMGMPIPGGTGSMGSMAGMEGGMGGMGMGIPGGMGMMGGMNGMGMIPYDQSAFSPRIDDTNAADIDATEYKSTAQRRNAIKPLTPPTSSQGAADIQTRKATETQTAEESKE